MAGAKIQRPFGTDDITPRDVAAWQFIEKKARECAALYGFSEFRTPVFEEERLFRRGIGDGTDVVQKEMFTFDDRDGETTFALRPEGTAGVVRALLENGLTGEAMPQKYFYLANCYRRERPQKGRRREFTQFGVECFGAADPAADFTVISLADAFIKSLGITGAALHINSIGCPECRPVYQRKLVEYLQSHTDELCETCRERMVKNPLRVLDCKEEKCRRIAEHAPVTCGNLCAECEAHFAKLQEYLTRAGINFTVDPHIVRGLDYYTRTVFEFISDKIGAQSTILGGGRYDGLVETLGGPKMAGIGFGAGLLRLKMVMEACGADVPEPPKPVLYVAPMGDAAKSRALEIVSSLRGGGIYAECDITGRSLKAQMKYADKISAKYTLIIGDSELESGRAALKNMHSSEQTEISLGEVAANLI